MAPESLEDVFRLLDEHGEDAKLVAGATAISIMLQQRLVDPAVLVSLGRIAGLAEVATDNGFLTLGALTTHREVENSRVIRTLLPALAETFGKVANVRVRNAATVGGVVAEADYASDPPTLFVALGATAELAGSAGSRTLPVAELITDFYETALAPGEVITRITVPLPPKSTGVHYTKFVSRSAEDRPCLGVAAAVTLGADGETCDDLKVVIGAVSNVPQRIFELEQLAVGTDLPAPVIDSIGEGYAAAIDPISDIRGSGWYRREVMPVCIRRALQGALQAARRTAGESAATGPPQLRNEEERDGF